MTDVSPEDAVSEILGVNIADTRRYENKTAEEKPASANPCWEEKHGPAVSDFDPDDPFHMTGSETARFRVLANRLDAIETQLTRLETAVNQVGAQTSWLVNAFHEAKTGFMTMSEQFTKLGPMGFVKMLTGNKAGKKGAENDG